MMRVEAASPELSTDTVAADAPPSIVRSASTTARTRSGPRTVLLARAPLRA